ncbi:MAG: DUF3047 domain-containing protein [Gammaproteobacteria bacterium]
MTDNRCTNSITTKEVISTVLSLSLLLSLAACMPYNNIEESSVDNSKPIQVALFSQEKLDSVIPTGWQELSFPSIEQQSFYTLVNHGDQTVIKAFSHGGASGILKKVNIDPKKFPILKWRWNINNILQKADINTKQGDDYPARIYVTFDYDINKLASGDRFKAKMYALMHGELPPLATLNYVWDNKSAIGTIQSNAYSTRVKMIVVQSGSLKLNTWITEQRNIYQDFKTAFGEEPPHITGIAIMTDTDNTGETATAYYGDISFHPLKAIKTATK